MGALEPIASSLFEWFSLLSLLKGNVFQVNFLIRQMYALRSHARPLVSKANTQRFAQEGHTHTKGMLEFRCMS